MSELQLSLVRSFVLCLFTIPCVSGKRTRGKRTVSACICVLVCVSLCIILRRLRARVIELEQELFSANNKISTLESEADAHTHINGQLQDSLRKQQEQHEQQLQQQQTQRERDVKQAQQQAAQRAATEAAKAQAHTMKTVSTVCLWLLATILGVYFVWLLFGQPVRYRFDSEL